MLPVVVTDDMTVGSAGGADVDFYIYVFKVQPCPKRGAHDWSSCPYAHAKEKARRRDPRVYKYASTPCPESLQGVSCGRGVDCPYAHSVYEYWLHPARFRTQMCKKGSGCNRSLCFFAHCASELRFPDTSDAAEAAAVDAAAASASSLPLLPVGGGCGGPTAGSSAASLPTLLASGASSSAASLPLVALGSLCSEASTADMPTGSGSYSAWQQHAAAAQAAAASMMRQGSCASQFVDDMSGSFQFGGSDSGVFLGGLNALAAQQQQQQAAAAAAAVAAHQQALADSLSEPLPRVGAANAALYNSGNAAAWLQLAAASQLPASQIMSSIQPPPAATAALAAQQQQMQALRGSSAHGSPAAAGAPAFAGASPSRCIYGGGAAGHSTPLAATPSPVCVGSSAEHLAASLAGISLTGLITDDNSNSSSLTTSALAGSSSDAHQQQQQLYTQAMLRANSLGVQGGSPPGAASGSSRAEDFMLLQLLQEKQQQQLARRLSGAPAGGLAGAAPPGGNSAGAGWPVRFS